MYIISISMYLLTHAYRYGDPRNHEWIQMMDSQRALQHIKTKCLQILKPKLSRKRGFKYGSGCEGSAAIR